ncbi:MAG: YdhR family protein [Leptolyngbyaceae cyanobacterium RU_5_1]|nr:YdhR family protein [Leptolyngbyaceae cyanobacterium RU_5_1]
MIAVLVQFKLPASMTREHVKELFADIAFMFFDIPGLIRKYFLLAEDTDTVGGVYLWRSRQDAERYYTENFRLSIREQFGSEPFIIYFESPVVVDNMTGEAIAIS